MTATFTESVVEQAALAWLESVGWSVRSGVKIAPGEPAAERGDYGQVVLEQRLCDALARLNPGLPAEALEDAFRKLTRPEGAELVARNRAVHRLLVDGVTVEYRGMTIGDRFDFFMIYWVYAPPPACSSRWNTPAHRATRPQPPAVLLRGRRLLYLPALAG